MTPQSGGLRPPLGTCAENVVSRLDQHAADLPDRIAIREPARPRGSAAYVETSFSRLHSSVIHYTVGLHQLGVRQGMRVALMVPPSRELICLVYALLKLGAVMVLVDPGIGIRNLGKCLDEAAPEAFWGIRKAQIARWLFGWAKSSVRISATISQNPAGRTECLIPSDAEEPISIPRTRRDDPAAILFTSGSTGVPKGAVYTHGMFLEQVDQLRTLFGIEPGEVDLCTFPLFALFAPALGMTSIIPRMDFTRPAKVDPREILTPAREFNVTNLFGSPALIDRVGRAAVLAPGESPGAFDMPRRKAPGD
jgi:acyl-CoA synthetase (AMP-forming)/AMP-acid ligase II